MKSSAIANSNIALVKYWGKRDEELVLPYNSSISVSLDAMSTTTTVEFDERYDDDIFILNGVEVSGNKRKMVVGLLDIVREAVGSSLRAKVSSVNNFPTAAGLASSASGSAALVMAASDALGMDTDRKQLSIFARKGGSGSASRSVYGGFVEWLKGEKDDGSDCYAVQLEPPGYWSDLRIVVAVVTLSEKKVESRFGMTKTVETCRFYKGWLDSVGRDISDVKKAIGTKDFSLLGSTAERNALKMHATMFTTEPSLIYWEPVTLDIIKSVISWREDNLESYFTIDAGPQVKVLCLEKDEPEIMERLRKIDGVIDVVSCGLGMGVRVVDKHLF